MASKQSQSILEHVISAVCGLSVGSPFVHLDFTDLEESEEMVDDDKRQRRARYYRIQQVFYDYQ